MSLAQLSRWCEARFGAHQIAAETTSRAFDVPWLVMDSDLARKTWGWQPSITLEAILQEISEHAEAYPNWLEISSPR
jgi:CDP-paratose 2-epimerase